MDHQTRRRHGRQELAAVFGLLMLLSIGLVVLSLSGRHWTSAALAGLLSVGMGLNLYAQLRRLRAPRGDGSD